MYAHHLVILDCAPQPMTDSGVLLCQVNTASMKVQVSIHGMRPAPRSVTPLQSTSAAVLAPGGGELVTPADNSMLQFWDAVRDQHVDKLQVRIRDAACCITFC